MNTCWKNLPVSAKWLSLECRKVPKLTQYSYLSNFLTLLGCRPSSHHRSQIYPRLPRHRPQEQRRPAVTRCCYWISAEPVGNRKLCHRQFRFVSDSTKVSTSFSIDFKVWISRLFCFSDEVERGWGRGSHEDQNEPGTKQQTPVRRPRVQAWTRSASLSTENVFGQVVTGIFSFLPKVCKIS